MMVYTIMVTYNGIAWVQKALQSITGQSKVIVIDNASTDATTAIIERNFPEIILVKNASNLGFGQANNLGIRMALQAGADYIFLMNQDVYVQPETINLLVDAIKIDYTIGVCSPLHKDGNGKHLDRLFETYISNNKELVEELAEEYYTQKTYTVHFVNAAAWLIKREVLEKIGGFDPIFFHYGEDENFIQRIHYNKKKVVVVPESVIMHDRQDRKHPVPELFSQRYIKSWEKHLKVVYANPNKAHNLKKRASKEIIKLSKMTIKNLLQGKFNMARKYWKLRSSVTPLFQEIQESRNLSKLHKDLYL